MGSTLVHERSPLADAARQRALLASGGRGGAFEQALAEHGVGPLLASGLKVLQINVGKKCNQTCRHCHVDAGPDRREVMSRETMELCLDAVSRAGIPCVDITGGAPELNPDFRYLVAEARRRGARVIDRCNLTILMAPGYRDLPEFLAEQAVEVVAPLPCYTAGSTDAQRGDGVFVQSVAALRRLNDVGYGRPGADLDLTLVYNPLGPVLPPGQEALEADCRRELAARHGIEFTRHYTITSMPISRFLDDLLRAGQVDRYMETLMMAFNPATVQGLMCRTTVSVSWDGGLHDCDLNQMLGLPLAHGLSRHIRDLDESLRDRAIVVGPHCFGCTAGHGSGCQGAVVS
jgi:radical SAM/Cys-rich protein